MSIFNDFPVGLFFMSAVILLLLVVVVGKFAWKPILAAIDERELGIQNALDAAAEAEKKMQNITAENEKLLKEARAEREEMLKDAREMKEKLVSDAKAQAELEANKMIESAKASIEQEKLAALADVKKKVADLSVNIAQKVVKTDLSNSSDQLKLVESLLEEVSL